MTGIPLTNRPRSVANSSEALAPRPTRPRQLDLGLALPTTRRAASRVPRTLLVLKALKVLKVPSGLMARPALRVTSPVERLVVSPNRTTRTDSQPRLLSPSRPE